MIARLGTALVAGALFSGFFYFAVVARPLEYLAPLARECRVTTGTITSIDWKDHARRTYEYTVDETRYSAQTLDGPKQKGAPVTVYYLPAQPGHSTIEEAPRDRRERFIREAWIVIPGFGLVFALVVWWRYPATTRSLTAVYKGPHFRETAP